MKFSNVIKYYNNRKVQEKILELCKGREVIPRYWNGSFGKRPDTIMFANDVARLVKEGVTSFHISEEIWSNPLELSASMSKSRMDELREGWDFLLDVDPKNWEHGRVCTKLLIEALESHGVKSYSIKFSGGKGWHVAVPWKAFPKKINKEEVRKMFPEASRMIAGYLKDLIKDHLRKEVLKLENNDLDALSAKTGVPREELFRDGDFNPYSIIEIDTVFIASRHLFRSPYSFNEKTWLVSLPLSKPELDSFELSHAKPESVKVRLGFLDKKPLPDEAENLIVQALDWKQKAPKEEVVEKDFELPEKAVGKEFFPPCIKLILEGLKDGRKRAVFILSNFLRTQGWEDEQIKKEILSWNSKNAEPLPLNYLSSQLSWSKKSGRDVFPPPNCDNKGYYVDIGICKPDHICAKIKNPSSYPFISIRKKFQPKKKGNASAKH